MLTRERFMDVIERRKLAGNQAAVLEEGSFLLFLFPLDSVASMCWIQA